MTLEERKPTGLLHSADELKQLIVENPDLPILVFAGDNANNGDYLYMSCSHVSVEKGEFLDCEQQDEFNTLVEQTVNEYDDFWKPCILLHVDG